MMWFIKPDIDRLEGEGDIRELVKALGSRDSDISENASQAIKRLLNSQSFNLPLPKFPTSRRATYKLLESLGLISGPPIAPTEKLAAWLPCIAEGMDKTLHELLPRLSRLDSLPSRYRKYDERCQNIEEFFEKCSFEAALPYLHYALTSELTVVIGESEHVVGEETHDTTWEEFGSIGPVYEVSGTVTYEIVEKVYECRKPIADGAEKAALALKVRSPELSYEIDAMLGHYGPFYAKRYRGERSVGNASYNESGVRRKIGDHR